MINKINNLPIIDQVNHFPPPRRRSNQKQLKRRLIKSYPNWLACWAQHITNGGQFYDQGFSIMFDSRRDFFPKTIFSTATFSIVIFPTREWTYHISDTDIFPTWTYFRHRHISNTQCGGAGGGSPLINYHKWKDTQCGSWDQQSI